MAPLDALREEAAALDAADALAPLRAEFHLPPRADGSPSVYLCGNSLGLQPRGTREDLLAELDDWARLGVDGHFEARTPWFDYHQALKPGLARICGAREDEVTSMAGLTTSLHALLVSFYAPQGRRRKILLEGGAFPSDRYALASHARLHGHEPADALVELQPRPGESLLRRQDVLDRIEALGDELALVMLGGVHYYTGQLHDIAAITAAGHAVGAKVGWDLAHAAGNVPLQLHDWDADFAAFCSYKYLNAGPGSAAGVFVHERWGNAPELQRLAGWWGNDAASRFSMPAQFVPARGADGWQQSNAPVFTMAPIRTSLRLFDRATMPALREKSLALTGLLERAIAAVVPAGTATLITPSDPAQRGCQLSLEVPERGEALHRALAEAGVVCDFRRPSVIRMAPVPLYNRFDDVVRVAEVFARLLG